MNKICRQISMRNPYGLHLKPASGVSQIANAYSAKITLRKATCHADAGSIFDLLILGVMAGDVLIVSAAGRNSAEALTAVCDYLESYSDGGVITELTESPSLDTYAA